MHIAVLTLAAIIATPIQMCVTNVEIHLTLKSLKKKSEVEELYLRLCHFKIIYALAFGLHIKIR